MRWISHHAEQHDGEAVEVVCPCNSCFVQCDEIAFLVIRTEWCRHAQAIKDAGHIG